MLTWEWAPGNVRSMKLLWGGPFYMASFRVLLSIFFRFFLKILGFRFDFFFENKSTFFSIFSNIYFSPFFAFFPKKIDIFLPVLGKKKGLFSILG